MSAAPTIITADDGARLSVWMEGPAGGAPVLLLHGFSLDHTTWHQVAAGLGHAGYRVIAPDLRGHGASTLGSAAPSIDRMVTDVETIITTLGLSAVHLVGHSLGAVAALAARSQLPSSLATVTSVAGTEESIQNPIMKLGAAIFGSRAGVWALGRQRVGRLLIKSWFGASPRTEDLDRVRLLSASCPRPTRDSITAATSDIDLRPTFKRPGPPTFVLCGRKDMATPAKISERIAGAIPDAELALIDRAGHMVIIEDADAVVDQLSTWLANV